MNNPIIKKIRELDIFSLLVFKLIFESGHANIVAKELGVSAPKVSRCLNALRIAFDDDLFYRRQQGLKPTPFAEKVYPLVSNISQSLSQLEKALQNGLYQTKDTPLKLAVTPMMMQVIANKLADTEVQNKIGNIELSLWEDTSLEEIHKGNLDFGLSFESTDFYELTYEKVGSSEAICVVAKDSHPLWDEPADFSLESICKHPFLYIQSKGFNDKIDPLEQFCREHEIYLPSISVVRTYEEWRSHLLTMNSLAFAPLFELDIANNTQGLRAIKMHQYQADRLHGSLKAPRVFFVERASEYRRYLPQKRDDLLTLFNQLFT